MIFSNNSSLHLRFFLSLFLFPIVYRSLNSVFSQHTIEIYLTNLLYYQKYWFSNLQCNLTGGNLRWFAMSVFLISKQSSTFLPFTHSVATELLAIADPHPKVLNLASITFPFSSTYKLWRHLEFWKIGRKLKINLKLELHYISTSWSPDYTLK